MTTVLAFDTCLGACSVALRSRAKDGDWMVREDYREMATGHAEALMPMIEQVMTDGGVSFAGLQQLAVTRGPGSFTGVRIGLSAARGFKLALGLPVVTATSLAVMAARADALLVGSSLEVVRQGALLAVAVDARGGNIYAEVYGASTRQPRLAAGLWTPRRLAMELGGEHVIAVGSGGPMLAAAIEAAGGGAVALMPKLQPHARYLAELAEHAPAAANLDPLYLRGTDAKPMAVPTPP